MRKARYLLAFAALALSTLTWANQRAPFDDTFTGSGTIRHNNYTFSLNRVTISLKSDRGASIQFNGQNNFRFEGRWTGGGSDDYIVDITKAQNDWNARGRFKLSMSSRNLSNITGDGEFDKSRFDLTFRSTGGGSGGSGTGNLGDLEFNVRDDGSGSYRKPGRSGDVNWLKSDFSRNGKFSISGDQFGSFSGIYRSDSGNRARITVDRFPGLADVRGDGTVQLSSDRRRVESLSIRGSSRQGSWNVDWRRGNIGGGGLDINVRDDGFGSYRKPGRSGDIAWMKFDLNPDGRFTISGDQLGSFDGGYRTESSGRVRITIDRYAGLSEVNGDGTLQLSSDRRRVDSISVRGNSRQGSWNVDWNRGGGSGSSLSESFGADGDLNVKDISARVSKITVNLNRNLTFKIVAEDFSRKRYTFEGDIDRWTGNTVDLRLKKIDGRGASGTGSIGLERGRYCSSIDIRGSVDRLRGDLSVRRLDPIPR